MPFPNTTRVIRPLRKRCKATDLNPIPLAALGTLSILPRELRDEIYRHIIIREYCLTRDIGIGRLKWISNDEPNSPRLMLSTPKAMPKAMREEVLTLLYAEAVFIVPFWVFCERRDCFPEEKWTLTRSAVPSIDRVQNVELEAALFAPSDDECAINRLPIRAINENLSTREAAPVSYFAGTKGVPRKRCVVKLRWCTPKAMLFLRSPFFDAIKRLTGFQTVTLQLSSQGREWCLKDAPVYIGGDVVACTDCALGSRVVAGAMSRALEPSLGPGVISRVEGDELEGMDVGWTVTFRPRDLLCTKKDLEVEVVAEWNSW